MYCTVIAYLFISELFLNDPFKLQFNLIQLQFNLLVILCQPSSCPAGHLRPFRTVLHLSLSHADSVAAHHDCHSISFHSLSLFLCTPPPVYLWPARSSFASGAQVSGGLAMLLSSLHRAFPSHLHCHILISADSSSVSQPVQFLI